MKYSGLLAPLEKYENLPIDAISPELMDSFLHSKGSLESSKWGTVNRDPFHPDKGFNVGRAQWRDSRASNVLDRLYKTDPELARQHIGELDKFDANSVMANKAEIEKWLDSPTGRSVQQTQMRDDFKNIYMAHAKRNGITTAGAAMVWADLAHRYGVGGARRFINPNGPTTLGYIASKLDELEETGDRNVPVNRRRMARFAKDLGGEAGAVLAMHSAATSVLRDGDSVDSVANELNYNVDVDVSKIIAEASRTGVPELPDLGDPVAPRLSQETTNFKEQLIREVLRQPTPQPDRKPDPIEVLLNAIIQYLIGGMA